MLVEFKDQNKDLEIKAIKKIISNNKQIKLDKNWKKNNNS